MGSTPENIMECLLDVVGLSQTVCPCSEPTKPTGANVSRSGYFITDQQDGIPITFANAATDCTTGGVWELLANARSEGVRQFVADLNIETGKYYTPLNTPYAGIIGKIEDSTAIVTEKSKAIFEIKSRGIPATVKITGLYVYSTVAGPLTVDLYSDTNPVTPLVSQTWNVIIGWNNVKYTNPVYLDLNDETRGTVSRYFLVFDIASVGYARNNRTVCGCGGYNQDFLNYVEVSGWSAGSVYEAVAGTAINHGSVGMGLAIEASANCTFGNFICSLDFDQFVSSGLNWVIATTLKHKIVMNVATAIIQSQRVNQYTLYSLEVIYGKRNHAQSEYLKGLSYIAQNMPEGAMQCFKCRDERLKIQTIFA